MALKKFLQNYVGSEIVDIELECTTFCMEIAFGKLKSATGAPPSAPIDIRATLAFLKSARKTQHVEIKKALARICLNILVISFVPCTDVLGSGKRTNSAHKN